MESANSISGQLTIGAGSLLAYGDGFGRAIANDAETIGASHRAAGRPPRDPGRRRQ